MKIPTQSDFINNRDQAFEDLFSFLKKLFDINEKSSYILEEKVADIYTSLYVNNSLQAFFDEYGEIYNNQEHFKIFCEDEYKRYCKEVLKNQYNNNWVALTDIESIGVRDPEMVDNDSDEYFKVRINEILKDIIRVIESLTEKEQARFKVAYLAIDNTLNIGGKQAPTDMPELVRGRIKKLAKKARLSFEAKKQYLREYLYLSEFWQKYGEIIGNKLIAKDQKIQKATYKYLLKKAKFSNTKRDKEKMSNIVNEVNFEGIPQDLQEKMKKAIKTDIKNFMVRSTLKPIPAEAYTPRENAIKNLRYVYCKEYSEIIPMYVKARLENKDLFDTAHKQILTEYLNHRQFCDKCKRFEKDLEKAMSYRIDRLKQIKEELKTSPYQFHVHNEKCLNINKSEDLIKYYKYIDKHYPSDLSKLYLLLAYQKAGKKDEVQKLLREINAMR